MITEFKKGNEVEKVILPKQPVILNPANLPEDLDEIDDLFADLGI